jgi:small-conductance mechanosensitive channel
MSSNNNVYKDTHQDGHMPNASAIAQKTLTYTTDIFSETLVKLIVTLIILIVGFIIGRVVGRIAEKVLHEIELDHILSKAGFKMPLEHSLATMLSYLVYFIAVVMTLNYVGLTVVALYIIVSGAVLLVLVATILGVKDFIPNLMAGIFIYRKSLFQVGQRINIQNIEGKVKRISIIETELITKKGDLIYIPNSLLISSTLTVKK